LAEPNLTGGEGEGPAGAVERNSSISEGICRSGIGPALARRHSTAHRQSVLGNRIARRQAHDQCRRGLCVPREPFVIVSADIPLEVDLPEQSAFGLLIVLGYQTRIAAGVFCLFCLATAIFFHLNFADPSQIFHSIKNLIMIGGPLQLVTYGAGAFSIDNRSTKSRA
jgi:cytochrome bd-type quinol oxidase subunit 1